MSAEQAPIEDSEVSIVGIFSSGDIGAIIMVTLLLLVIFGVLGFLILKIIQQRRLLSLIESINNVENRKDVREVTMRMKKAEGSYADQYQMETLNGRLKDLEQVIEDKISFG
jgi:beta-lactamase regulating signal transducer with metallopeptidase domain